MLEYTRRRCEHAKTITVEDRQCCSIAEGKTESGRYGVILKRVTQKNYSRKTSENWKPVPVSYLRASVCIPVYKVWGFL